MRRNLFFSIVALICVCASAWAQKPKVAAKKPSTSSVSLSRAEKMGYARTNKYWGPGTYYCFAPGAIRMKMVNNSESAMRDLTGISKEDFLTEVAKQGFVAVPPKEVEKWVNYGKIKSSDFLYSPDKSYIMLPGYNEMEMSAQPNFTPISVGSVSRFVLIPKQDSLKVLEMVWQYLRDLNDMKLMMSSFGSTFKKADPKAYPVEQAGASGWSSLRAGSFVLKMVNGKPHGYWNRHEDIIRRTIGKPEFELRILGAEIDFGYGLHVMLQKEGYVLAFNVVANTLSTLPPGASWVDKHKVMVDEFNIAEPLDKKSIDLYKNAPFPPVLEDLNKLLHIR